MKNSIVKYFFPIMVCLPLSTQLYSQNPGGVKNVSCWKKDLSNLQRSEQGVEFNYNSFKTFKAKEDELKIEAKSLDKITLFAVFSSNNRVANIGSISVGKNNVLITDSSFISRKEMKYKNFGQLPKFICYQESLGNSDEPAQIVFGGQSSELYYFDGAISEVIVFDKIIKKEDRQKVESYLSIKYGISLPDTAKYFNSDGKVVFDGKEEGEYRHNVTAIGRDKNSELFQKQSHNLYSDLKLEIGLDQIKNSNKENESNIENKGFIFWADNKGALSFNNKHNDFKLLERSWKISSTGNSKGRKKLQIRVNFSKIESVDQNDKIFIIFNNDGDFSNMPENISIEMINQGNGIYETAYELDAKAGENEFFTFMKMQSNLVNLNLDYTLCDDNGAKLNFEFLNKSKFNIEIKNEREVVKNINTENESNYSFNSIPFGEYEVLVNQNNQTIFKKEVSIKKEKCYTQNLGESFDIYPNPVMVGSKFTINTSETEEEKLKISIVDVSGKTVAVEEWSTHKSNFTYSLKNAGYYSIIIEGDKVKKNYKLIVVR